MKFSLCQKIRETFGFIFFIFCSKKHEDYVCFVNKKNTESKMILYFILL